MCGIYFYQKFIPSKPKDLVIYKKSLLKELKKNEIHFSKIAHRGPDNSVFINDTSMITKTTTTTMTQNPGYTITYSSNKEPPMSKLPYHMLWGFHRLSINGQTPESNQPFFIKNCRLICNGEIYNFRALIKEYGLEAEYKSQSDCEIIIHLYRKIGMAETLRKLDGVFALVLHDYENKCTFIARDPVGVRSLYIASCDKNSYDTGIIVTSEMKAISDDYHNIMQFPPGCYAFYKDGNSPIDLYKPGIYFNAYYENLTINQNFFYRSATSSKNSISILRSYHYNIIEDTEENICANIARLFEEAVVKRLMSDRKVGALLSGGLDSSAVVAMMCRHMPAKDLNTYSIGLKGSTDLMWARKVADYLGTNHHEVCLSEEEFLSAIKETIYQIESYDTTSVRASVPNYLISKYIFNNSDDCVIYCGDMSDEIFGSYRGFMKAKTDEEFHAENVRMVRDVCYFDLLRSDKSISGAGLEARVPFADKKFLQYVMSIPARYKRFDDTRIEKYIFRKAFQGLLPDDILWRRKEAFSDGVSGHGRSWFQIIREHIEGRAGEDEYYNYNRYITAMGVDAKIHNKPYDAESLFYRNIFVNLFSDCEETIPYFWRHPFCEEKDPSARLLECYKNTDV
jgi:asparagine synthase (glutamine-hydrolysing)